MPSSRKFYKAVYNVEILSEHLLGNTLSLEQIQYLITEGGCSGRVEEKETITLDAEQAARELIEQGSDPTFFGLTSAGDDAE